MEKALFQDYPEKQRRSVLEDNADKVEEIGYMKPFTPEEMEGMKDDLSKVVIGINDIEEEKKSKMDEIKMRLKPLDEEKKELLSNIKNKSEYVTEQCFKMIDHDNGMVGYYNNMGMLVESRPIRQDEKQKTLFTALKTGTND